MNKIKYILGIAIFSLFGCSEEQSFKESGSAINFEVNNRDSRTYYKAEEGEDAWQLCWDNDTVKIACEMAYGDSANYAVKSKTETTGSLSAVSAKQLKWGDAYDGTHYFYSAYPYNKTIITPNSDYAIYKFPFVSEQTVTVDTSLGFSSYNKKDTIYYSKPDMSLAYMVASTAANRKTSDVVKLEYRPIMTTLDVTVQRDEADTLSDGFTEYGCFITGLQLQVPVKSKFDNNSFYYKEYINNQTESCLCDEQGNELDNVETVKTINIYIKTTTGNNYINLRPGQKVKLTAILPPVDIAKGSKIKVLGEGLKNSTVVLDKQEFKSSEKKQINVLGLKSNQVLKVRSLANWMGSLDDNALVCRLSIPGAKHANAVNQQSGSTMTDNNTTHVQHLSYNEMANNGCRAFEFRVNYARYDGGGLFKKDAYCYIGKESAKSFHDNYKELVTALNNHPTEFFILYMNLQNSTGMTPDGADEDKFKDWLVGYLLNKDTLSISHSVNDLPNGTSPKDWIVSWKPDLTVGECRGKLIVITNFDIIKPEQFGIVKATEANWDEDSPFSKTSTYSVGSYKSTSMFFDLDRWKNRNETVVKGHLYNYYINYQFNAINNNYWIETRLGSPNGNWEKRSSYLDNAQKLYPYYTSLVNSTSFPRPLGSVMLHFFGEGSTDNSGNPAALTKTVINNNYRYKLK